MKRTPAMPTHPLPCRGRDELISTPPKLPCKDTLFTRFAPSLVVCAANLPTSITTPAHLNRENSEMRAFRSSVFSREEGASLGASSSL